VGAGATVGARLSGELAWTPVAIGVELRVDLPGSSDLHAGGSMRTWLTGGALVPCWNVRWASICAVGLLARIRVETVDVSASSHDDFSYIAAGLRLGATLPVGERLSLRLGGDILGTMTPFVVDVDAQRVYRSPVLSGIAGATLVRFF
jgi:hypothetical protein